MNENFQFLAGTRLYFASNNQIKAKNLKTD